VVGPSLARELVAAFLGAEFNTTDARYAARLEKVSQMERMMKSGEVTAA
jgi:ribose 5-phosphate isomerase RpiB